MNRHQGHEQTLLYLLVVGCALVTLAVVAVAVAHAAAPDIHHLFSTHP